MVGSFFACCARATDGHAAAPPISLMNSRRLIIRSPRRRGRAAWAALRPIGRYLDQCLDPSVTTIGRFGFVRLQAIRIGLAPVGEIHDLSRLSTSPSSLGRLYDVESLAVEEERVLPKQAVQLRNHWMVVRNGLALELGQSSFDLCGR